MISSVKPGDINSLVETNKLKTFPGIILHHTAIHTGQHNPQAEFVENYHLNEKKWKNGMGYHFLIEADGTLKCGKRWKWQGICQGSHQTGWNHFLGVAFAGHFGPVPKSYPYDAEMPKEKQIATWLKLREQFYYRIPVYPHLAFKSTKCPGDNITLAYWFKVIAKPRR